MKLSDVGGTYSDIDILVGSDYWGLMLTGEKFDICGGLTAQKTIFGWTLSGKLPDPSLANTVVSMLSAPTELSSLWNLDQIGIQDSITKKTEAQEKADSLMKFNQTVERGDDGRYVVALPWNGKEKDLPTNFHVSMRRLESATEKLKQQDKWKCYNDVFLAWEKEGLIKEVESFPVIPAKASGHFLPHRQVFKDSATTPVRPVYDASCHSRGRLSLNAQYVNG